jgi:hypothetical protein
MISAAAALRAENPPIYHNMSLAGDDASQDDGKKRRAGESFHTGKTPDFARPPKANVT